MKLFAFTATPNNRKVVAFIKHYDLPVELVEISFKKHEQKTEQFLTINPMGRVPALQDGEFCLWESNAILMYLCECFPDLEASPKTARERADTNRWLHWQSSHFGLAIGAHRKEETAEARKEIMPLLAVLDNQLAGNNFICGEISPADFAIGAYAITRAAEHVDFSSYPNIQLWRERVQALKGFNMTQLKPR
jgi:glutathione S-transferase